MNNPQLLYGTGKRKNAIARVRVMPGGGQILVNGKALKEYFGDVDQWETVMQPLQVTETQEQYNVVARVKGGGITGQSQAIRHGLARALQLAPDAEFRPVLKKAGYLTRDARKVERKKYGQPKARKQYQFSKR